MNELIYDLWCKFINNELLFAGVIQTACKAQANACARAYEDYGEADEINYNKSKIKNAQIERGDYE